MTPLEKRIRKEEARSTIVRHHIKTVVEKEEQSRIIMVPGMFSNAGVYKRMQQELEPILLTKAIDLTGHGSRSNEVEVPGLNFYSYVNDVLEEASRGPCILIGHSLGALACLVAKSARFHKAYKNIHGVITISSSCPRGIFLPLNASIDMLRTPEYVQALICGTRFRLRREHAFKYMLSDRMQEWSECIWSNMESESGIVLRQLVAGIPLHERLTGVYMFSLGKDFIATPEMQNKLSERIGVPKPTVIDGCCHMELDNVRLLHHVRQAVLEIIESRLP